MNHSEKLPTLPCELSRSEFSEDEYADSMEWATLKHSEDEIVRAGEVLISSNTREEYETAYEILNNWRAAHSFPLNTFQVRLRGFASDLYINALVAQRLKRSVSIIAKLRRFKGRNPRLNLYTMQDIAGCRAIVDTVSQVKRIESAYYKSKIRHEKIKTTDYILRPKPSGYRGVHLIYKYISDENTHHNGRLIEVQLRSQLQHAWATTVETVGAFLDQALKSSEGSEEWLNFFKITASAFAMIENTTPVPNIEKKRHLLLEQVYETARVLRVQAKLEAYTATLAFAENHLAQEPPNAHYYLLSLDLANRTINTTAFAKKESKQANDEYLALEKLNRSNPEMQIVLVAVDSISNLRRSYPNYFLDTRLFVERLNEFTSTFL